MSWLLKHQIWFRRFLSIPTNIPGTEITYDVIRTLDTHTLHKLDHSGSKKVLNSILATNNPKYQMEQLLLMLNDAKINDSPMYAFIFDEMVNARLSGDKEWVTHVLNTTPFDTCSFKPAIEKWRDMEAKNTIIDWLALMPETPSTTTIESTWNRILSFYCRKNMRFLAWKVYIYLVESKRLRIRTAVYFLEIVKHQRRDFNKVFSDIMSLDPSNWDQHSCQAMMRTTCDVYRFKKALELLQLLQKHKKDDLSVYVMLIMKLTKRSFFIDAKMVLEQLVRKKYDWGKEAWMVVANYYVSSGSEKQYRKAHDYIQKNFATGADLVGLEMKWIWLSELSNDEKVERLQKCFDDMLEKGIQSNGVVLNFLVQAFGEMGYESKVTEILDLHQKLGVRIGLATFEIMIRSRIKTGVGRVADIIELIEDYGLKPTPLTYSLILEAHTIHPTSKLIEYYNILRENQIRPKFDTMQKVLKALHKIEDWDSFVVVSRHMIVNPHFSLHDLEDVDFIAQGYKLGKKADHMKFLWDGKSKRPLLPTTYAHIIDCFLSTEYESDIPIVWTKARSENAQCPELSLAIIRYWKAHYQWHELEPHFKEQESIVHHSVCSEILQTPFLEADFRWTVYEYIKQHHIPSEMDFLAGFEQKVPERLEAVLVEYQSKGYNLTPEIVKAIEPLLKKKPVLREVIEMQMSMEF